MAKTIKQTIHFNAGTHEVFELIMDEVKHAGFSGAPCKMPRKIGGKFTCYGDYIKGENLEIVKDKKIVQNWIGKDFPAGVVSKVKFEFFEDGKGCRLEFMHSDLPDKLAEPIDKGWYDFYWDKMKKFLGE